jgi:hypothetical protein
MTHRTCLIAIASLALVTSGTKLSAQSTVVQVEIRDYTQLRRGVLHDLVSLTQQILTTAGVSVQVKLCKGDQALPCENQPGVRSLMIRLVPRQAKQVNSRRPTLGHAFADQQGGTYASVFLEPIQDEAAMANVPLATVIAYATAHEVGHLLLGSQAHTGRGLMKANWNGSDYQAMVEGCFHFSDQQTRQLARLYGTRSLAEMGW